MDDFDSEWRRHVTREVNAEYGQCEPPRGLRVRLAAAGIAFAVVMIGLGVAFGQWFWFGGPAQHSQKIVCGDDISYYAEDDSTTIETLELGEGTACFRVSETDSSAITHGLPAPVEVPVIIIAIVVNVAVLCGGPLAGIGLCVYVCTRDFVKNYREFKVDAEIARRVNEAAQ